MVSLKAFTKILVLILLLVVSGGSIVHAETKLYQYDGKLPFVQMMLNMMTAMGIIDRLPNNGFYANNGLSAYPSSSWSRYSNSPNNSNTLWGNPSWGVLPPDSYSPYRQRYSDDFGGWVNEPWEASNWNAHAEKKMKPESENAPIVQNFNFNNSETTDSDLDSEQNKKQSPLAKISPPQQNAQNNRPPVPSHRSDNRLQPSSQQKLCVTDYCGLQKPNLNGLWLAQNGEMLGVKNHRYLWSDSKSRYLTGQLKIQNEYLLANVDGHDQMMRFKYKLSGNRLLTMQPDGKVREFVRASANPYNGVYPDYGQNHGNSYYQ
jgi:hypothetical protein